MLCVLALDRKELELGKRLAQWIAELGGVREHELVLIPSKRTHEGNAHKEIQEIFETAFGKVTVWRPTGEDEFGWPDSANYAWRQAVQYVEWNKGDAPFFWMECDAVPLVSDWLDRIAMEYRGAVKPFMGSRVDYTGVPIHLSGISVYHQTMRHCPDYAVLQFQRGYTPPQVAWDVSLAAKMLPKAHFTDLIQHEWKPEPFNDAEALNRLNPKAVVYHQCKDASLIDRMMEARGGVKTVAEIPVVAPPIQEPGKDISIQESSEEKGYPKNTIFTYYAPLDSIDQEEQRRLLKLWEFSWFSSGWNPVVLGPGSVNGSSLRPVFKSFPSINPDGYDLACFLRWIAVSNAGGGFMCDYDVMNNGLKPFDIPDRLTIYQIENPCPSFVGGSADEFLRVATAMAKEAPSLTDVVDGRLHVSDQNVLQKLPNEYDEHKIVSAHGKKGWWNAKVVHFANETMQEKQPRSRWIPHLMYSREPR